MKEKLLGEIFHSVLRKQKKGSWLKWVLLFFGALLVFGTIITVLAVVLLLRFSGMLVEQGSGVVQSGLQEVQQRLNVDEQQLQNLQRSVDQLLLQVQPVSNGVPGASEQAE